MTFLLNYDTTNISHNYSASTKYQKKEAKGGAKCFLLEMACNNMSWKIIRICEALK